MIVNHRRFFYLLVITVILGINGFVAAQGRYMGGTGITVFEDPNFRGQSATYSRDMPNLSGTGLENRISSLRIGPGESWEVCEDINYRGRCVVVSGEESDLDKNDWNNKISSFRKVGGSTPSPAPQNPYIVLFSQINFRGNPTNYTRSVSRISRPVGSITIGRGAWEVCTGYNFTGRCDTLTKSESRRKGRVRSLRPIGPEPR